MKVLMRQAGPGAPLPGHRHRAGSAGRAGNTVVFAGTGRGIEARVLPARAAGAVPHRGKAQGHGARCKAADPGHAAREHRQAAGLLRQERPDVVVGVGGYASGPVRSLPGSGGCRS